MERISELIKEAKPLYQTRKRTARRVKTALLSCMLVLAIGATVNMGGFNKGGDYLSQVKVINAASTTSETSVIEEMGLPVDEYGLFTVN